MLPTSPIKQFQIVAHIFAHMFAYHMGAFLPATLTRLWLVSSRFMVHR